MFLVGSSMFVFEDNASPCGSDVLRFGNDMCQFNCCGNYTFLFGHVMLAFVVFVLGITCFAFKNQITVWKLCLLTDDVFPCERDMFPFGNDMSPLNYSCFVWK